jgi:hypothetical protein
MNDDVHDVPGLMAPPLDSSHNMCKGVQMSGHGGKNGSDKMHLSGTRLAAGVSQHAQSFLVKFRIAEP